MTPQRDIPLALIDFGHSGVPSAATRQVAATLHASTWQTSGSSSFRDQLSLAVTIIFGWRRIAAGLWGYLQRPTNLFLQSHCRSVFLLRCHEVTTDGSGGMISHFINEPDHWRARAEEARNLADQMNDPESNDAMLRIADDYERLANRAENRAAGRLPNWMKPKGTRQ